MEEIDLTPHLIDIVSRSELQELILAGGFGIQVKRDYLARTGRRTWMPLPIARSTIDLDLFLRMEILVSETRKEQVSRALADLGYRATTPNFLFAKTFHNQFGDQAINLDLMSRHPMEGETVKVASRRVGSNQLHGRETIEAFAVDVDPISIPLKSRNTAGEEIEVIVYVPHPYAWLNMKVRASHDWLRMEKGEIAAKPAAEKHPADVYVLVAMLIENELERAVELAAKYFSHPVATAIREEAKELFSNSTAPGSLVIRRRFGNRIDFDRFSKGLSMALGPSGSAAEGSRP